MRYFQFHDDYFDALSTYLGRECTFLCLYKIKKNTLPFTGEYSSYRLIILSFHVVKWSMVRLTILAILTFLTINIDQII